LTVLTIAERRRALEARLKSQRRVEGRILWAGGVTTGLSLAGFIFVVAGHHTADNWIWAQFAPMLCALGVIAAASLWSMRNRGHRRLLAQLDPVPEESEAELQWLLDRVPATRQLVEAVRQSPRGYVRGELAAVRGAYQAAKANAA
jgi:protein-S-isoprenylcysteine O-methyltransferase Ste14